MAEKNPFVDQATAPKVRARPEAKRSIVPTPGGLPLPPSKQTAPSPKISTESSSIPTASAVASAERSMSPDLFGLPKFQFAPQLKSSVGKSSGGLSSIKSPTHLPNMANLTYPNILGNFSTKAGSSKITSSVPKPPDFKSVVDGKSKDGFVKKVSEKSTAKTLPQRPTDLPLFESGASSTKHTSEPFTVDKSGDHKSKNTMPSTDLNKSKPDCRESGTKGKGAKPSTDDSTLESNLQAASSAQGASASFQLPESSANVEGPEQQDCNLGVKRASDPTPTMPEPEHPIDFKRSSESMPVISNQTIDLPKSTSFIEKVKRRLRKFGLKRKIGTEDAEDTTGLMFESSEPEQERRPQRRSPEDEKRYENFPTETYNHFWAYDPILPKSEVESKCQMVPNIKFDSPTESNLSGTSSKSEPFLTSPEVTYVEESKSKSNPATPTEERTSGSTPLSLDIDRPSSKSSPASLDLDRMSKDGPDEACVSESKE